MASLESDVVDFLRGERKPLKVYELIRGIQHMAAHNPAWTNATWAQWEKAVEQAVATGTVRQSGEWLTLAPPPELEPKKPSQLELF